MLARPALEGRPDARVDLAATTKGEAGVRRRADEVMAERERRAVARDDELAEPRPPPAALAGTTAGDQQPG